MAVDERSDFAFGLYASEEERLAADRARLSGVTHERRPRDPRPGEPVALDVLVGPLAEPPRELALELVGAEWNELLGEYVRRYRAELPGRAAGTVVEYVLGGARYAYAVDEHETPGWARDAVVYHVFLDRFARAGAWDEPPFMGGTLSGLRERLDHVVALGATALWLSPIHPSPTYHRYDATDLRDVDPRLGTLDDFRGLVADAHAAGIHVLLDFVPNHWSNRHPTFLEAEADPNSRYRDWYGFHADGGYDTFFGVRELPKLNLEHEAARAHVLDAARFWLDLGVDGFRVDHAIGPAQSFWAHFRAATVGAWTFGEATTSPRELLAFEGLLDGCLDFPLHEALRQTFALGRWDGSRLASFLDAHERYFPPSYSRPSFLDNHDMNRFSWTAGGDVRRLKLAALCQFTLAGPPVVYYGTEVGLGQERDVRDASDAEARRPMPWGDEQDAELSDFYRRLVRLRREHEELRTAQRVTVRADAQTIAYARGDLSVELDLSDLSGVVLKRGERVWQQ